jgi:hypothetical protein
MANEYIENIFLSLALCNQTKKMSERSPSLTSSQSSEMSTEEEEMPEEYCKGGYHPVHVVIVTSLPPNTTE